MKILSTIVASLISLSLLAQNVNITFTGANNNRNYQVVIDGSSYYSNNATENNGRKLIALTNLPAGPHNLEVYRLQNNSTYNNGTENAPVSGTAIYSKTFQTRTGYDMNISVKPNGLISFSEKPVKKTGYGYQGTAMSSTAFNQLVQTVKAKRYQSEKIGVLKTALTTQANYFTTSQVKQLLLLVSSESSRLELAKLSYSRVTDPNNFIAVYDVFNNEANRDALDEYVVSKGGVSNPMSTTTVENNTIFFIDSSFGKIGTGTLPSCK